LLVDTPRSLLANQELEFEVLARGPGSKTLQTKFVGRLEIPVEEEDTPGTRKRKVPELKEFNPRPYELKLIREEKWEEIPYWSQAKWDAQSVGCFFLPTKKDLLTLVVNMDYATLKAAREEMVKKGLLEATIEERVTKYCTHVALHLYEMYRYRQKLEKQKEVAGGEEKLPLETAEEYMIAEIERAANTVLRLLP
jgi:hypothetical protein